MPIVNVKGVANQMQFPDDMDINDIRAFLQKKFTRQSDSDLLESASKYGAPTGSTAAPYEPSLMEKASLGIGSALHDSGIISNKSGAYQVGKNVAAVGEMLPGVGDVADIDNFLRAKAEGDNLGMGLAMLGAIPIAGELAKKAGKVASNIKLSKSPFDLGGAVNDRLSIDGSHIDVVESKWSPTKFSIVEFLTDEKSRGQGKGGKLLDEAITKYGDELSGAFSSKESLTAAYNRGFRPIGDTNKSKSLDQLTEGLKGGESVTMSFKGVDAEKGAGSGVDLKPFEDALKVEQEKYDLAFKPLKDEYKTATPERQKQLMAQSRRLKKPVGYAQSELTRAKMAAKPKAKPVEVKAEPDKTFKGKVFHQTSEQFDEFDLSKGADGTAWFTGDKKNFDDPVSAASAASGKSIVLEREVELKKAAGFDELDKYSIDELRQQGYDGAILDGDIQVFDQKAIKPAMPAGNPIMDEAGNAKFIEGDDGKFFKLHKRSGDWVDITGTAGEANAKAAKAKGLTPNADKSPAQYRAESAAQAEGYKMQHTAPLKSDGNPSGVNVEDAFPGMYSGHSSDYLTGVSYDDKAIRIIQGMKGKPEKPVTIYRAVPKDVKEINATDWITTTKEYAQDHMEGEKGWHILSKKVKAKDIATDGNSIHEFGYDPIN